MLSAYEKLTGFQPNPPVSLVPPVPLPAIVQTASEAIPSVSPQSATFTVALANIPHCSGEWLYVTTDRNNGDEIAIDPVSFIKQENVVCFWQHRENLDKYTNTVYCQVCPLYGQCDFEGSYEELEQRLFPKAESIDKSGGSRSFERPKKRRR
ncbi:MAG: hypothetical protein Fur006_70940 [Coleofasciculaceae cyanobacterium]